MFKFDVEIPFDEGLKDCANCELNSTADFDMLTEFETRDVVEVAPKARPSTSSMQMG
jgi:hypothetical protein